MSILTMLYECKITIFKTTLFETIQAQINKSEQISKYTCLKKGTEIFRAPKNVTNKLEAGLQKKSAILKNFYRQRLYICIFFHVWPQDTEKEPDEEKQVPGGSSEQRR